MLFGVKTPRHLTLAILFVGLIALEIAHGTFRIGMIQERERTTLLESVTRGHRELAGELRRLLAESREHAVYLSRLPSVRRFLDPSLEAEATRQALESSLLPYVVSFRRIDRVRALDRTGLEQFRCERIGKGVGSIPHALLSREPDFGALSLLRDAPPGGVVVSGLVHDSIRVEVPEGDRQVLHFGAPIESGASRLGYLVLTAYAAPVLQRVRAFTPFPHVVTSLIDHDGTYLAQADRSQEKGQPTAGNLDRDVPDALAKIRSGEESFDAAGGLILAQSVGDPEPRWRLVTYVPFEALRGISQASSGEYGWVIAVTVTATAALALAGVFLVRMSIREVELREAARYRKQEAEMNRRMQLSERLGSLGLLTAGVAHEINNPLEGIENYLALLDRDVASSEKQKRYVEMIRYGFHRIRDIVRDLSVFARPGVETGTADISAAVTQALKMVSYTKEFKQVHVDLVGLDMPIHVPGEGRRLEQVFLNLLLNAGRAMGGQGGIAISARPTLGADRTDEIEVVVDDTGPGIPAEALPRIFDPFFTTTDGTGLGLSISYGIVEAHGGSLSAENRPGGGARFTLRLPTARPVATLARQERRES